MPLSVLTVPQPSLAPLSTSPPSSSFLSSLWIMICLFLRIVEDKVCLVLVFMVDMNQILLCWLPAELTGFLLVELARVVDSWLWCLLVDLTKVHLAKLIGVALSLPIFCPNPSSFDFWPGFFYKFDITNILVIFFIRGIGGEFLVGILCIASVPVVILVPSSRRFCRSSLIGTWQRGGMWNSGRTASLIASQYFNIIVQLISVCAAWFWPLHRHPRSWAWRFWPLQ